jgi:signal transduction histidine kinase
VRITTQIAVGYAVFAVLMASLLWLPLSRSVLSVLALVSGLLVGLLVTRLVTRTMTEGVTVVRKATRELLEENQPTPLALPGRDEFAGLAEDLNALGSRWNETRLDKERFFSHAAHELKAPIAGMQESVQILMDPAHGPLTPTQKRLLDIHRRAYKRVALLLDSISDLHRHEAGTLTLNLRNEDLGTLIHASVAEYRPQDCQVQMRVELPETPLIVECDGLRISRAIGHLLVNAAKWAPANSAVRLSAVFLPSASLPRQGHLPAGKGKSEGFVLLTVTDCGPGVPDAHKEKIFENFRQGKDTKYQRGIGVGLSFCRAVAAAHHGSIWVEDNPGGGSIFSFILPAVEPAATTQALPMSHPASAS